MSELEEYESRWHLDKKVPIALIFAIFCQTVGVVWFGAQLATRVDRLEVTQAAQEAKISILRREAASHSEGLAVMKETNRHIAIQLDKLNGKLDQFLRKVP